MPDTAQEDATRYSKAKAVSGVFAFPFSTSADYTVLQTPTGEQVHDKTLPQEIRERKTTDQGDELVWLGGANTVDVSINANVDVNISASVGANVSANVDAAAVKEAPIAPLTNMPAPVRIFPDQEVSESPTDVLFYHAVNSATPSPVAQIPNSQRHDTDDISMEDNDLHVPPTGAHPSLQRPPPPLYIADSPESNAPHPTSDVALTPPSSYAASVCRAQRERLDTDKVRPQVLHLQMDREIQPVTEDERFPLTPGSPDKMRGWTATKPSQPSDLEVSPHSTKLEGFAHEVFTPLGPFSPASPDGPFSFGGSAGLTIDSSADQTSPYSPFSDLVTPSQREIELCPAIPDADDVYDGIESERGKEAQCGIPSTLADIMGRTGLVAQKLRQATL